jgi:hypothetical protein
MLSQSNRSIDGRRGSERKISAKVSQDNDCKSQAGQQPEPSQGSKPASGTATLKSLFDQSLKSFIHDSFGLQTFVAESPWASGPSIACRDWEKSPVEIPRK